MISYDISKDFPNSVLEILAEIQEEPFVTSIWFIGSRANQLARPDSDWDFLVFCSIEPEVVPRRHSDIDVIRIGPSGRALVEGMSFDYEFSFQEWQWSKIDEFRAYYLGNKFINYEGAHDASDPVYSVSKLLAYRIWSRGE